MPSFHEKQWQFLVKSLALGKVSHAYLFSGQHELGKKELALEFAKLVNCSDNNLEKRPCKECPSCRETRKGCHPDFLLLEIKEAEEQKQINMIRDLALWLSLRPALGAYKVVIIDQLQNFSFEAQSALLKILEEPSGEAIILIISDQSELLLSTIVSRAQEIKFFPWSAAKIVSLLVSKGANLAEAQEISYFAFGRSRRAINLLTEKSTALENQKKCYRDFSVRFGQGIAGWFKGVEIATATKDAGENGEAPLQLLENWLNFLRIAFLQRIGAQGVAPLDKISQQLLSKTNSVSLTKMKNFLMALERTNYLLLRTSVNPRLALENAILELF
jgi:DNA polymerase-3 subunit delta'